MTLIGIILLVLALILPLAVAIGSIVYGVSFLVEYWLVLLSVSLVVGIVLLLGKQKAKEINNKTEKES